VADGSSWRSRHLRLEHRRQPLLPRRQFHARIAAYASVAGVLISCALAAGMIGYHTLGKLGWTDSFLNASMILGGMGPVDTMPTPEAKVFAGCYALLSGMLLLVSVGILLAPLVHRILHRFHIEGGQGVRDD
jgi:hypothetical protein